MLLLAVLLLAALTGTAEPAYTNHATWQNGRPIALPNLQRPAVETAYLYRPATAWTYSHHADLAFFHGRYYASWSNGRQDEDAPGQRVLLSTSADFLHWSQPRPLVDSIPDTNGSECILTAAGFHVYGDTLAAYFGNYGLRHQGTRLEVLTTTDGEHWSAPRETGLPVNPNFGPQPAAAGRLIISGNISFPWTDDPAGLTGWHLAGIYPPTMAATIKDDPGSFWGVASKQHWPTALCEGSFFADTSGVLHMFLRATGGAAHDRLWVTHSADNGLTWSAPVPTGFSNCNSKFQFGRLPDGRVYYLGNPLAGNRTPLVLSLSADGRDFTRHFILGEDHYPVSRPGHYKGGEYGYPQALIHDGNFNVILSRQKEGIEVLRVPLSALL